jgi:hypothetical protein
MTPATPIQQLQARLADPQLRDLTALTFRSAAVQGDRCPRSYWLYYCYQGLGIRPMRQPLYFIMGTVVHEAFGGPKGMLTIQRDQDRPATRDEARLAIDHCVAKFRELVARDRPPELELTDDGDGGQDWNDPEFNAEDEQAALLEGMLWGWWFRRAERFCETYRVLEVEEEDALLLGKYEHWWEQPGRQEVEVWWLSRADALLEERTTKGLYPYSLKTAGKWELRKDRSSMTDMQGVSEAYCIEQRLGRKVLGVQMEYLIKGERKKGASGVYETYSPLIRGWQDIADTPGAEPERYWRWEWRDPFGSKKQLHYRKQRPYRPWYRMEMGVEKWVEQLHLGLVQADAGDALAECIVAPDYYRDERQLRSWFVGVSHREVERRRAAEALRLAMESDLSDEPQDQLDRDFPQYTHTCDYPTRCPFKTDEKRQGVCFGSVAEAEVDPMLVVNQDGQEYGWREPHHREEAALVQIQKGQK